MWTADRVGDVLGLGDSRRDRRVELELAADRGVGHEGLGLLAGIAHLVDVLALAGAEGGVAQESDLRVNAEDLGAGNGLLADLDELFAQEMFGNDTKIRLRPSYFPFTEPSAEMDISCNICGGKGCSFCKHTGWVEILGCGMVDPAVLEANGIDSSVYTGYAFGMGIERITNLKYQVKDLRMFSENDTRFLEEFESAN